MNAPSKLKCRSGKVKVSVLLLIVVLAAGGYYGFAIGGVYWRQYRLQETVARDLSAAGQFTDATIRQRLIEHIADMNLPLDTRNIRFSRTDGPRALRVSISYVETVNLLFTKKQFPMSVDITHPF